MDVNSILSNIYFVPQWLTNKTVEFLASNNITVTTRWTGLLFFVISLLLVYIGIKITKPLIKWILILFGILLILGLLIPGW